MPCFGSLNIPQEVKSLEIQNKIPDLSGKMFSVLSSCTIGTPNQQRHSCLLGIVIGCSGTTYGIRSRRSSAEPDFLFEGD